MGWDGMGWEIGAVVSERLYRNANCYMIIILSISGKIWRIFTKKVGKILR